MSNKKLSMSRWIGSIVFASLAALLLIAACALEGSVDTVYERVKTPIQETSYVVTFDSNGSVGYPVSTSASPSTIKVTSGGTSVGSLPRDPARDGFTFIEWNTRANGNGTKFTETTPVWGSITVYAQWQVDWDFETPPDSVEVLAKIKEENIKYWVDDDVLAVYAQDKNVPDAPSGVPRTHLYFIYSKTSGDSISFDLPDGWTIDGGTATVNNTNTTQHTLRYAASDGTVEYGLWLFPVAQYEIVFGTGAAGTVTITDSTDPIAEVSITATDTQRTKYAIGSVNGATTIKITDGIRIAVKDEDGPVDITESTPGSLIYTGFTPQISSQEYTITVSPTLTKAAALAFIQGVDKTTWVDDGILSSYYPQDLKVPDPAVEPGAVPIRTNLYFINSKTGNGTADGSISLTLPPGWTSDQGLSFKALDTGITEITLSYTASDGPVTYGLWLWPVAQYKIVFGEGADGIVTISDGTGADAVVDTSKKPERTRYAIGSVVHGGTIIKINSGIKIDAIKEDDTNATVNFTVNNGVCTDFIPTSQEYTINIIASGGGPSEQESALAAIRTTEIKEWVNDGGNVLSTVYPDDKNVIDAPLDEPRTHLYFIHSKTTDGNITINGQNGWTVDDGASFEVDPIEITEKMLTHTSGAKYGLWLFPVAEYEIVFEPYTEGTIKITDGTSKVATIGPIVASNEGTTRYAIGVVNDTTTIIVEKGGIAITVTDGGGAISTHQDPPGTYEVTGTLASDVYTITASSTRSNATDAMTFIEAADIAGDWGLDSNILASYSQDINVNQADVNENPRTHLYFIHKNITNSSISFTPPDGWTIDGEDTVVISETDITKKQLKYTAKDGFVTYWLWLVPVAQFNVKFGSSASGTIRITDGTDGGKPTTTDKKFILMVRNQDGNEVTAKITIEGGSSNIGSISVKNQDDISVDSEITEDPTGTYSFNDSITSQIYTVNVNP